MKETINQRNFHVPPTHSGMYMKHNPPKGANRKHHASTAGNKYNLSKKTRSLPNIKNRRDINKISQRECAHIVNQQLCSNANILPPVSSKRYLQQHNMLIVIRKKQTHHDLVRYLHAACFAPVPSTWKKAIRNSNFITWPGLTVDLVNHHLPTNMATVRGHIHQERQNLQSTRKPLAENTIKLDQNNIKDESDMKKEVVIKEDPDNVENDKDYFPISPIPNKKTNKVAYVLIDRKEISTAYKDLTGRFPVWSSRGNEYIMVGYHYDANCILGYLVKNTTAGSLTKAW